MNEFAENPYSLSNLQITRAVKLSYAQAMLGSVYGASVGGMFLIGYALMLGADNRQIGLMSTVPMLFIGVQLLAAAMVERGISRRQLTVIGAIGNVLGWGFVILIPFVMIDSSSHAKITALITSMTLLTIFAYISGNARGSWVGDLIPASYRGTFFGRMTMFGGIVGTLFALIEGGFLDVIKSGGIKAYTVLFGFGIVVGLINALLFLPQADVPLERKTASSDAFKGYIRDTFKNKALIMVMFYALLWSLQAIAGPFYTTYMIRDLKLPFLGVGVVNAVGTLTMLFFSPFWGRMVDRYGCRPILILCTFCVVPFPLMWLFVPPSAPQHVYYCIIPLNLFGGFLSAGISVGLSTLIYKVTPSIGRSVQFAIYSILVVLAAAPMPTMGGYLTDELQTLLPWADLRITFFMTMPFVLAAALVARKIQEESCLDAAQLLRDLPGSLIAFKPISSSSQQSDSNLKQ